jgi:hypothetical protein
MSDWISVKDRLPTDGEPVLTYDTEDDVMRCTSFETWGNVANFDYLTHWMPLPKPPQFDEARMDIIGQNGNDGLHYE